MVIPYFQVKKENQEALFWDCPERIFPLLFKVASFLPSVSVKQ